MNIKATLATALSLFAAQSVCGQTLEKMNWFNEPAQWNINEGKLSMQVTPQSDYWRISHYGFTVDDAPFYYAEYGGEFEAKVKVSGDYKVRLDQAGMMIRIDHVIALDRPVDFIWIKAVRRLDAIEIFYSFDDKEYTLMRNAWMEANRPVKIGMMAACPDGNGFRVTFSDFSVKHLPDATRLKWLEQNAAE